MPNVADKQPRPANQRIIRIIVGTIALGALAIGSFWGAWEIASSRRNQTQSSQIKQDFTLIQWGAIPQPIQLVSTKKQVINIPSSHRYTIIQYISKENTRTQQALLYAQYLCHDVFLDKVSYVVVINPSETGLIAALNELKLSNLDVYIDRDHNYVQHFALPTNLDSAISLDGSGVVRFSALGLAMQDALRVLFNRYSGFDNETKINQDSPMLPYRIGEQMPSFEVQDIRSGETFSSQSLVDSTQHPLWIFTAECAMCSLPSYLQKFIHTSDPGSIPIFSSRIPIPILKSDAETAGYKGPLYVATEEIPIFEDLLHDRSLTPYAALVDISKDGRLTKVKSLTPFQ